jgi:hypothetical protein
MGKGKNFLDLLVTFPERYISEAAEVILPG